MKSVDVDCDFERAFPELYQDALALARRMLPSLADAEDAAAEALARTLVRWDRVGPLPHRTAWVLRVTANVAIDVLRRRRVADSHVSRPVVDHTDNTVDDRALLLSIVRGLPRRQREALVLRHLGGLSEAETAVAMGVSVNSVKTHARRGLRAARATGLTGGIEDG